VSSLSGSFIGPQVYLILSLRLGLGINGSGSCSSEYFAILEGYKCPEIGVKGIIFKIIN
jgi:hypothetical protein